MPGDPVDSVTVAGSIENYMSSYNGKLLTEWLKAGYAVITIEKSGLVIVYNCVPAARLIFTTDIESFDAGYTYMESNCLYRQEQAIHMGNLHGGVIARSITRKE